MLKNSDGTIFKPVFGPNPLGTEQEFVFLTGTVGKHVEIMPAAKPPPSPEKIAPQLKHIVKMHCQPAKRVIDEIYDEVRITYGQPFDMETVIIDSTDLEIMFWHQVDKAEVGSVVFPFEYSKKVGDERTQFSFGEFRWWKITEREQQANGWLCKGVISDYQPKFG